MDKNLHDFYFKLHTVSSETSTKDELNYLTAEAIAKMGLQNYMFSPFSL